MNSPQRSAWFPIHLALLFTLSISLAGTATGWAQAAGAAAPKYLFDPTAAISEKQFVVTGPQVSYTAGKDGVTVTVKGGDAGFPGLSLKPTDGPAWDLSPWGRVDAKVTNLSTKKLRVGLRVDNEGNWKDNPWNTELVGLNPGESKVVKVYFGYAYDFKPGYKLNPGAVSQVMFFIPKTAEDVSFRVEDIQAIGSAGEKPPIDPSTVKAKPANGVLFSAGTTIDPAKQLVAKGGAKTSLATEVRAVKVDFSGGKNESATFKPSAGSWSLADYCEVKIKVKNIGQSAVTPKVRLESKGGVTDTIPSSAPIAPNAETEITISFVPSVPWQGEKEEGKFKIIPGTGTTFTSNWTNGVTLLPDGTVSGPQSLLITSAVATASVAQLPKWLGQRPPVEGDWVKTFEDNFDGDTLDREKWNIYTANYWDKRTHFTKDNIHVKNGELILHYEKKTGFHNDDPSDKQMGQTDYACGYVDTYGKWVQRYGYFESRLKPLKAPGLWPALWLMPDRGVAAGPQGKRASTSNGGMEFDIWEFLSGWGPYRYNIAMHWDGYGKEHKSTGSATNYIQLDKDGYVTAGLLWTPGLAVFYCNGKEVLRWENPRISSVESYIIFYTVSGGWDNEPLDDAKLPDDFIIDYIRVWQRKDLASAVDGKKD